MPSPSVSVVIPAHNAARFLPRALESVLRQSHPAGEILVVDDGSSDATPEIVRSYRGLRLIQQPHRGAADARNSGIRAAGGELIAFLDADDEWLEAKLQKQLSLHRQGDLALSYCRSNEFDPQGRDLGDTFREHEPMRGANLWRALLASNFIATPTVMASRALLLSCGGFNEGLKVGEDQDMWIRLALLGRMDYLEESLVRVHARADSLSASGVEDQLRFTLPMIEGHLKSLSRRLTLAERRLIRGARLGKIGRDACAHGEWRLGLGLIASALRAGDQPLRNIYHLIATCPLRRHLGVRANVGHRSAPPRPDPLHNGMS